MKICETSCLHNQYKRFIAPITVSLWSTTCPCIASLMPHGMIARALVPSPSSPSSKASQFSIMTTVTPHKNRCEALWACKFFANRKKPTYSHTSYIQHNLIVNIPYTLLWMHNIKFRGCSMHDHGKTFLEGKLHWQEKTVTLEQTHQNIQLGSLMKLSGSRALLQIQGLRCPAYSRNSDLAFLFAPTCQGLPAERYWVGGEGNWQRWHSYNSHHVLRARKHYSSTSLPYIP